MKRLLPSLTALVITTLLLSVRGVSTQAPHMPAVSPWQAVVGMFNQLPSDLRQKVGIENVGRIYRMPESARRTAR